MGAVTEAVVVALGAVGSAPVLMAAIERAVTIATACLVTTFVMVWFDAAPLTYAWLTPLVVGAVQTSIWLVLSEYLYRADPQAGRRRSLLAPGFWPVLRTFGYTGVGAVVSLWSWSRTDSNLIWRPLSLAAVAGGLALLVEFFVLVRGVGEKITSSQKLSENAELSVLEAGHGTIDESTVSAEDLDAQLAYRYQRAREEAEAEVRRYLPTNPRTAKRMVNHVSLAMTIAEQRGLFRDSELTQQHLGKWVGLSEQWPALGAALTTTPERMADLEQAVSLTDLQKILDDLAPGTTASDEMRRRLQEGVPLGRLLDKLVRFEAT